MLSDICNDDILILLFNEILENRNNEVYKKALVNVAVCSLAQIADRITLPNSSSSHVLVATAIRIINESFQKASRN